MIKLTFYLCENKDADQLCGNREADQRLCFRYMARQSSSSYLRNFDPLALLCGCTAWFVSELVGNPENRYSHNEAHMLSVLHAKDFYVVLNNSVQTKI